MAVDGAVREVSALPETWDLGTPTEVRRPEHGINNLVWLVQVDGGDGYVLRIHHNVGPDRIALEHMLLAELDQGDLSFAVPVPIPADDRTTLVATDLGPASLYRKRSRPRCRS